MMFVWGSEDNLEDSTLSYLYMGLGSNSGHQPYMANLPVEPYPSLLTILPYTATLQPCRTLASFLAVSDGV